MARRRSRSKLRASFKRRLARWVIIAITLALGAGGGLFLRGKVVSVADGDTITIVTPGGSLQKVRLYGVDCPESGQAGGKEATAFTSDLVLFQEAELETVDTDRYGRSVAIVTLKDGRSLNRELVAAGHAWVYRQYCRKMVCASWIRLEANARQQKRGLWRQKSPVPPWKWRSAGKR